jgi:nucleoid-associated protein YgaU
MFAPRLLLLASAVVGLVIALGGPAEPTRRGESHYLVKPGDTLWRLAVERYDGDPREAVWLIRKRNRLVTSALAPGTELSLPAP